MQLLKTIGKWVLQLLLAVVMVGPGMQKFTSPTWERIFRNWGYPYHFYLVIGAIEVAGGIGLLIPKVATPSALVLAVVMVGAAITQIRSGSGRNGVGEMVFCLLLLTIAYLRRRDMIRFGTTPSSVPETAR